MRPNARHEPRSGASAPCLALGRMLPGWRFVLSHHLRKAIISALTACWCPTINWRPLA